MIKTAAVVCQRGGPACDISLVSGHGFSRAVERRKFPDLSPVPCAGKGAAAKALTVPSLAARLEPCPDTNQAREVVRPGSRAILPAARHHFARAGVLSSAPPPFRAGLQPRRQAARSRNGIRCRRSPNRHPDWALFSIESRSPARTKPYWSPKTVVRSSQSLYSKRSPVFPAAPSELETGSRPSAPEG